MGELERRPNAWALTPLVVLAIQHPAVTRTLSRAQRGIDRVLGGVLVALGIKVALS